ncbi:coproporphyrinogen III oxidase, anaerobic [Brevibacterium iodinum ATCC 49514]|uniref:Heme chaperone HemW n=1 Tax=Brevibacterium iodinum ATCC 49514 TaxID=1255616 RepID=A0A2H1KCZ9_9MICO|nr:radical SAM family heme chaperone HemW [Brevibacterium iodinum]SMX97566.1 coproporphyrinogen III oxidase, anaerobic [Brevibacterium iodinum ATCC 49514]SUW12705.1 Oxygen-independent coproporphyrinogen-III oxidase [Brevibacterium iodinum]
MPAQPTGEVPPRDGSLPTSVGIGAAERGLSLYIHVPYCRVRCGYCDFNTYTADDLGPGASREDYRSNLARELDLSVSTLAEAGAGDREVSTIFFGGGTPTLLAADVLAGVMDDVRARFRLAENVEVTTEANPDTLDPAYIATLAGAGFNRISMGMQSAVPHVLATLDRTHDPEKLPEVARWVKDADLELSLDLIYGTPGESIDDWRRSLDVALSNEVDHISAYSLIVEPGTKMGARVRRGELPMPDEDDLADKYEIADSAISAAGLHWYEVSNWSTGLETRCEHNMAYWRNADWWGFGPGAHSHVGGVRFWNAKHPRAWADRLLAGESPSIGREVLDVQTREIERIMLAARIDRELRLDSLAAGSQQAIRTFVKQGLLDADGAAAGWFQPTLQGRLMADYMVRILTEYV